MSKIFTGKTVDDAVSTGLNELGVTREQIEILILDQGSKGFLGIGAKPARVQFLMKEIAVEEAKPEEKLSDSKEVRSERQEQKKDHFKQKTEKRPRVERKAESAELPEKEQLPIENPSEDALKVKEFLTGLIAILNINGRVDVVAENDERAVFNVVTEDSSSAIGYRGEVLDSFQSLAGAVYNTDKDKYLRVVVDCENYRAKREKTLVSLAYKLAAKAVATGRKVTLEPMNPFERRVIHSALMEYDGVKTVSEGKEPNRFVSIIPDNYDPTKNRGKNGYRGGKGDYRGKGRERAEKPESDNSVKTAPKAKTSAFSGGVFLGNSLKENKPEE